MLDNGTWDDQTFTTLGQRCTYFPRDVAQQIIDTIVIATAQMAVIELAASARNQALADRMRDVRCSYTRYAITLAWGERGPRCVRTERVPGTRQGPCE